MIRACADEDIHGPPSPLPHNSCLCDHTNLPFPDVSRRLPAELLASIFTCIAHDSYIESIPTAPSWVNVSYVCHYWRDVALNCPTLWSYIPATTQRWAEELLARSQMAPLRISLQVTDIQFRHPRQEREAQVLSILEQVMKHSQRIQKLYLNVQTVGRETGHQILSKFLFGTRFPCLQHLEISDFDLPEGKSWSLFWENTPVLCMLGLNHCSIPWSALGSSVLTTLRLSRVGIGIPENTMTEFLSMLRRMPHIVQLSVERSLPSARDFLSNGEFDATPTISLPYLSKISIVAPLSTTTALLSCIDVPLKAKVQLQAQLENSSESMSTFDDCIRLASLLAQRIDRPDSPKFRSLTISQLWEIALTFGKSKRVEIYSPSSSFPISMEDNALLKVIFVPVDSPMDEHHLSGICNAFPLANIQSVHFILPPFEPEFWRVMLTSLSDVWHIRFSRYKMPNITSMLSLPSHPLTRSWQDGRADTGQGEIFVPGLKDLELHQTILHGVRWRRDPNPYVADVQDLYNAIATRKETRCRLTIKECHLEIYAGGDEYFESVGRWEGDQFSVISTHTIHGRVMRNDPVVQKDNTTRREKV